MRDLIWNKGCGSTTIVITVRIYTNITDYFLANAGRALMSATGRAATVKVYVVQNTVYACCVVRGTKLGLGLWGVLGIPDPLFVCQEPI